MKTSTELKTGPTACPICKSLPDRETGRCRCAHIPGYRVPTPSVATGTLVTQAESLFENYLAARLVRSRRALTAAKVAVLRDPRDRTKLEALRIAEAESVTLQSQLLEQSRRLAIAHEDAENSAAERANTQASHEATADFRMKQAARAQAAYPSAGADERHRQAHADDRICPNCGERHRSDTSICVCGYNFLTPEHNRIAEPFLTAEEVAALRSKPSKRPD